MDRNKPQKTSDEEGTPPPALLARTPFRPLSRRRRQEQLPEPEPAVERPAASSRFSASPNTIGAALARNGFVPLVWGEPGDEPADGSGRDGSGK